jgi:hypothetical protein
VRRGIGGRRNGLLPGLFVNATVNQPASSRRDDGGKPSGRFRLSCGRAVFNVMVATASPSGQRLDRL